ncbi:MAG: 30S ribosomal protein S17 [Waddliaceae bacterium]|nr:30S ribosomal protein S17 [Waddliaceae bacterium]
MADQERGVRRVKQGVVVSTKMDKTAVVLVQTKMRHPVYQKVVLRGKKYYAHDEKNLAKEGDTVTIAETRPMSKLKRWRLVEATQTEVVQS